MKSSGGTWTGFTFQLLLRYPQTHPIQSSEPFSKKKKYGCQTMHPISLKFKTYSPSLLDHNFEVSYRSMKRFKSNKNFFLKIFASSNMAVRPCDINYSWINWCAQGLRNICLKFPLDLSIRSEDFYWFYGKSNMADKPCDLWPCVWRFCSSRIGGHMCTFSPRSVQSFQRKFLKV